MFFAYIIVCVTSFSALYGLPTRSFFVCRTVFLQFLHFLHVLPFLYLLFVLSFLALLHFLFLRFFLYVLYVLFVLAFLYLLSAAAALPFFLRRLSFFLFRGWGVSPQAANRLYLRCRSDRAASASRPFGQRSFTRFLRSFVAPSGQRLHRYPAPLLRRYAGQLFRGTGAGLAPIRQRRSGSAKKCQEAWRSFFLFLYPCRGAVFSVIRGSDSCFFFPKTENAIM